MPNNTSTLVYNFESHQYEATLDGVKNKLNVNLDQELGSYREAEVFLRQASDRVYTWLYGYIRREGIRILEKRIADNFVPDVYGLPYREGIEKAIYAQIEYMINFDGDLQSQMEGNKDALISSEARQILHLYGMAHKGAWAEFLEPSQFRVGY